MIQDVIDKPGCLIGLFIRICLENNGKLSKNKRNGQLSLQLSENARDAVLKGCPSYLQGHTLPDAF